MLMEPDAPLTGEADRESAADQILALSTDAAPGAIEPGEAEEPAAGPGPGTGSGPLLSRRFFLVNGATALAAFAWGVGVGYWEWGRNGGTAPLPTTAPVDTRAASPLPEPPSLGLPHSYTLPIAYANIGPHLLAAGAFAYDAFAALYRQKGKPLSPEQQRILKERSDQFIVIDHGNADFLLNLLWAVGLANNNPILRTGPLLVQSEGKIDRFASTGGWTLAAKPLHMLYSGSTLAALDAEQQARLEEAADSIYRPCCDNPTSFPDCNHGMAMLGLLELMAAQGASVDELLEAAKMVNSFWFPSQAQELALYYQAQGIDGYDAIPAREAVGVEQFSGSGYGQVRNWLAANGKVQAPSGGGNRCGV
jgi:hypothetical protein